MIDRESTRQLARTLNEVLNHVPRPKDKTIFSLGGRGYYENPASDLLAFFLKPDGEHQLGSLFLDAFFECMEAGMKHALGTGVVVEREKDTGTGGRLDLILKGSEGVLLIENKIRHHQNSNPFDAYREYGERIRCERPLFMAILSPDGRSVHPEWDGVSYKNYCEKLSSGLERPGSGAPPSKWWDFAREFVLHLKNELYPTTMTQDQIEFAEQHEFQLQEAKRLGDAYRQFLNERLREVLAERFPDHGIWTKDDGWGIRCKSARWGESDVVWWSKVSVSGVSYGLNVYLCGLSEAQLDLAKSRLQIGEVVTQEGHEGGVRFHYWIIPLKPMSREKSEEELTRVALVLDEVLFPSRRLPAEQAS